MRYHEITEGEVVPFPTRRRRRWRHLIEILHFPNRSSPWVVFLHGEFFNAFRTEAQALKFADQQEKSWDREYERSPPTRIVKIGRDWILLNKGSVVGTYSTPQAAIAAGDEIDPNPSTKHWIDQAEPRTSY
jgi:hypothetical protein